MVDNLPSTPDDVFANVTVLNTASAFLTDDTDDEDDDDETPCIASNQVSKSNVVIDMQPQQNSSEA